MLITSTRNFSVMCFTETWCNNEIPDAAISLPGYTLIRRDRESDKRGGGVICMIKNGIPYKRWNNLEEEGLECIWLTLRPNKMPREFSHVILGVIYHPPQANNRELSRHITNAVDSLLQRHPSSGIIITGDFNHFKDSYVTNAFKMKQLVKEPTRENSVLDKFYTTMSSFYEFTSVKPPILSSDHCTIECFPKQWKPDCSKHYTITRRSTGHNERVMFVNELKQVNWTTLLRKTTCDEQYSCFKNTINSLMDKHMPLRTVIKRKQYEKPWITNAFRNLIDQRQHAFMVKDNTRYKKLRNRINKMSKKLKSKYYHETTERLRNSSPHKWWSTVKNLIGHNKNTPKETLQSMANTETNGDFTLLADKLNVFFQSISIDLPKLQYSPMPSETTPDKYIITTDEVEKRLSRIDEKKAIGPDGLPNWVLKDCAHIISPAITCIFNSCIREGHIPTDWKSAIISPVPKVSPPRHLQKDLRPISLTPLISKHLERFIFNWILESIEDKIDQNQFGALKGSSTTHALVNMVHEWYRATDDSTSRTYIRVLLLDYAKAFDRIDPYLLIDKLKLLNIPDTLINLVKSFLTNRRQRVRIGETLSDWIEIWGNTPQGTVLGVLLFLIMINDLKIEQPCFKFVDDTTVYEITNTRSPTKLQETTNKISHWSETNKMKINENKTKELIINFNRSLQDVPPLLINDKSIEKVTCTKLLGLYISENLTWQRHIDYITSKASSRVYFITLLKRSGLSYKDLITCYTSVVRPVLEYAAPVFHSNLTKEQCLKIESIQKRVMRIIYGDITYTEALQKSRIPSLEERRETLTKNFFRYIQRKDDKLNKLLSPETNNSHDTRKRYKYKLPQCKTSRFRNSFIPYCLFKFQ